MEKKYIIKLEENEIAYKTVDSNGTPLIQLLAPTPYTEPDIEKVREEAYKNGYDAACKDIDIKSKINAAYRKGLEDAWECAKKIYLDVNKGGLSANALTIIFGNKSVIRIFEELSASEAIEKIRQYEKEKEEMIDIDKNKVEALANDIGIHKLFALVKEIRGE